MSIQVSNITKSKINRLKKLAKNLQSALSQAHDQIIAIALSNDIFVLPSINKSSYYTLYTDVEEVCFERYEGDNPSYSAVMEAIFSGRCFPVFDEYKIPSDNDQWWGVLSGEVTDEKAVERVVVAMLKQSWWEFDNGVWNKVN